MEQVEAGLQIYVGQVGQEQGGLQIDVEQVGQEQGVCPAEPLHLTQVELPGRGNFQRKTDHKGWRRAERTRGGAQFGTAAVAGGRGYYLWVGACACGDVQSPHLLSSSSSSSMKNLGKLSQIFDRLSALHELNQEFQVLSRVKSRSLGEVGRVDGGDSVPSAMHRERRCALY